MSPVRGHHLCPGHRLGLAPTAALFRSIEVDGSPPLSDLGESRSVGPLHEAVLHRLDDAGLVGAPASSSIAPTSAPKSGRTHRPEPRGLGQPIFRPGSSHPLHPLAEVIFCRFAGFHPTKR